MLERYAALDGERAAIEGQRNESIAAINATADKMLTPVIEEMEAIAAKIEPWWAKSRDAILTGKRKSVELGGCMIGTRSGSTKLAIEGQEKKIAERMKALAWARRLLRFSFSLKKADILKALDGKRGDELREFGFSKDEGEETFFLQRAEQSGTIGGSRD